MDTPVSFSLVYILFSFKVSGLSVAHMTLNRCDSFRIFFAAVGCKKGLFGNFKNCVHLALASHPRLA